MTRESKRLAATIVAWLPIWLLDRARQLIGRR